MPASPKEIESIRETILKFIDEKTALAITSELHNEVGQSSTNSSLKQTLKELHLIFAHPQKLKVYFGVLKTSFRLLVIFHMMAVSVVFVAAVTLPFIMPYIIGFWPSLLLLVPLEAWILHLVLTPVKCPLTRLENYLRKKLQLPEIDFFVGHYILRRR